ncbi:MAG: helix-turn-helix transcriptional regulator [Candidatus Enteromonas sp.]|nr:helix-turn-helix transcriptional regulator [Candidatus Enteromonas sp.]
MNKLPKTPDQVFLEALGLRIAQIRYQRDYSMVQVGVLSGLSKAYLCDLEHGRRNPSALILRKLASALECNVEDFFTPFKKKVAPDPFAFARPSEDQ